MHYQDSITSNSQFPMSTFRLPSFGNILLPETLYYTSSSFNKYNFYYGNYSSFILPHEELSVNNQSKQMAEYIRNAMKHFWKGYEKCAFGYDEIKPIVCKGDNNWGGTGMTIIDSLDTLYIMNLTEEYDRSLKWWKNNINFNQLKEPQLQFELTIRVLGGLLSMYTLTRDPFFKEQSIDYGNRIYKAIGNNIFPSKNIIIGDGIRLDSSSLSINAAEAGSFQLEFMYLSKISGNPKYQMKAEEAHLKLKSLTIDGLLMTHLDHGGIFSWGGEADSAYEYMLKCWLLSKKHYTLGYEMFLKAKEGLYTKLTHRTKDGMMIVSNSDYMDHLTCFAPGLIALYASTYDNKTSYQQDIEWSKSAIYTCYQMYMSTVTHLSGDLVFINNTNIKTLQKFNLLRPETVESLYILNKVTGDPIFRKWGWDIFVAFENYSKIENGYTCLNDVNKIDSRKDETPSFFSAETLKYLYLLFDTNSKIDLKRYVFNTEAHLFRI